MHAFVAEVGGGVSIVERDTPEGLLSWKPLSWVCDPDNDSVVGNIPRFLPAMLDGGEPREFRCEYESGCLAGVAEIPLPSRI